MDLITIIGLIVVFLIVVIIIPAIFIFLDLMSYTGRSSKSMTPPGNVTGRALVVYNPGISGMAKAAANDIASELQSRDYDVKLAGVRSADAIHTSDYDVVIVGGPLYMGKLTKSISDYFKTLKLQKEVKLGVFATTGSDQFHSEDFQMLTKQVEMLTADTPLNKKITIKLIRSGNDSLKDNTDLVFETIQ
ncbi:MAG TPA: flavodoxin domain-containing protein [Methanobacteriaceae archaeon]|nr:flavodoxin domain-containing protein [Methanobacteriaceae archaeon]